MDLRVGGDRSGREGGYLEGMLVWDATGAARDSSSCDKCGILLVFDIRYLRGILRGTV